MIFKKLLPHVGPADLVFVDPDSGYRFRAPSRDALIKHIIAYRQQNGLEPIEELTAVLENYWCGLPENRSNCVPLKLRRGFARYMKGGIALLLNILYRNTVSQAEADRRAEICTGCTYNVFPKKGWSVAWADAMAEQMVGQKKSKHHNELGNCEVCTCPLRAKVFWKGKIDLTEKERKRMTQVGCWQTEPGIEDLE